MKKTYFQKLVFINIIFSVAAFIFCFLSSKKAYAVDNIYFILGCIVVTILLDVIGLLCEKRLKKSLFLDVMFFATMVLTCCGFCQMILGRINLMGYVWFSDLESGNAVAVGALNLSVIAWICFVIAMISNVMLGFRKIEQ